MTTLTNRAPGLPTPPSALRTRLTWAATGLFVLVFGYSAAWSLLDPSGTRADTVALGFPGYFVYPQAIAKVAGLVVILTSKGRWPVLTGLAFAGFLYDVLLALAAHVAQRDPARASLAVLGIVATLAAFWAHQQRYGRMRTTA